MRALRGLAVSRSIGQISTLAAGQATEGFSTAIADIIEVFGLETKPNCDFSILEKRAFFGGRRPRSQNAAGRTRSSYKEFCECFGKFEIPFYLRRATNDPALLLRQDTRHCEPLRCDRLYKNNRITGATSDRSRDRRVPRCLQRRSATQPRCCPSAARARGSGRTAAGSAADFSTCG